MLEDRREIRLQFWVRNISNMNSMVSQTINQIGDKIKPVSGREESESSSSINLSKN